MRTRSRFLFAALLAAAVGAGSLFGGVLRESPADPARAPASVAAPVAADRVLTGFSGGRSTDPGALERRVTADPANVDALVALGYAYQQRWRESADASVLPRSAEALRRALRLEPENTLAVIGLGSLALIRHEFRQALALGRRAQRLDPASARALGIVGDALLELGRYEPAFAAFERMVALKPTVASYARIAYARELLGDLAGATRAMQLAVDAATGDAEPSAWSRVELAKLQLSQGRLRAAEQQLRTALALLPGYVYAYEQLARVKAARGDLRGAVRDAKRAADAVPLPQFVALLAALHERAGDRAAARAQGATLRAIDRLLAASGVRSDVETIVSEADRLVAPRTLVARARAARADRPSIHGDDALAWALARTGRCEEARRWSQRSLRLGTRDGLLFFHRAEIERCAGNPAAARRWARRALALGPAFSVRWAPAAERLAR